MVYKGTSSGKSREMLDAVWVQDEGVAIWSLDWKCILLEYNEGYHIRYDANQSILCLKSLHSFEMGKAMKRKDKEEENGAGVQLWGAGSCNWR